MLDYIASSRLSGLHKTMSFLKKGITVPISYTCTQTNEMMYTLLIYKQHFVQEAEYLSFLRFSGLILAMVKIMNSLNARVANDLLLIVSIASDFLKTEMESRE